jgi:hypothetical protein
MATVPRTARRNGDQAAWLGRATGIRAAAGMLAVAAALTAASVTLTSVAPSFGASSARVLTITLAVLCGFAALLCLVEAAIDCLVVVRVTSYLVQVRPGLLPLSGLHIPVRDIHTVRVTDAPAQALRSLGWWWMTRRAPTILVRPGPALALQLHSGREVVISVDHPLQAAQQLRRIRAGPTRH